MQTIYFDHAATTPMHPEVAEVMLKLMQGPGGNASSMHSYGRAAKQHLSSSRDTIAAALRCRPSEVLFTSGGTESDNLAIIGSARAQRKKGNNHIITSAAEHHAVLHTCKWLEEKEGFELTIVPVDETGAVSPEQVAAAMKPNTGLVSIMHGNNEVGTLTPVEEIGSIVKAGDAIFHVDAVQTFGKIDIDVSSLPIDLLSISAHKINGPQGVGALYIAQGTPIEALAQGGSQERKRRAGTENIAGICGFAAAAEIALKDRKKKQLYMDELRMKWLSLLNKVVTAVPVVYNGSLEHSLPHIVNVSFIGVDTETMLMNLDIAGIAAASGSACTSGALERSHVLHAMGISEERMRSAVRFSFGLGNTIEELEYAAQSIAAITDRIRENNF